MIDTKLHPMTKKVKSYRTMTRLDFVKDVSSTTFVFFCCSYNTETFALKLTKANVAASITIS